MRAERARFVAFAIFLVCLSLSVLLLFVRQFNQSDFDIVSAVANIIGLYAVPLSIIATAVSSRKAPEVAPTPTSLALLFGSTILWNAVIVGLLAYYDWSFFTATAE